MHVDSQHWQQHLRRLHQERLAKVRGLIDNKAPESTKLKLGSANNPKRAQLIADQEAVRDLVSFHCLGWCPRS